MFYKSKCIISTNVAGKDIMDARRRQMTSHIKLHISLSSLLFGYPIVLYKKDAQATTRL